MLATVTVVYVVSSNTRMIETSAKYQILLGACEFLINGYYDNKSGVGNGNPLQYSHPENPLDRGAWLAIAYGVAKSWTQLID